MNENNEKKIADPGSPDGQGGTDLLLFLNQEHLPLREWGLSLLDWKPCMRILDVGCGGGATIRDMLRMSPGSIIDGIDTSEESVRTAGRVNQAELGKRVFIRQGDVCALPYQPNSFDLVTAVETVYFWANPVEGMRQIHRVLKPGGTAALLFEVDAPEHMDWGKVNFEMTVYTTEELEHFLREAGFDEISSTVREDGYLLVTGKK